VRFISTTKIQNLVKKVAALFKSKRIFLSRKRHIVFVCGGHSERTARKRFLRYAKEELPDVTFFQAEIAEMDCLSHNKPTFLNLSDFEALVAAIADCLILFPETPGAIAELGLFSGSKKARKKLLVAIAAEYQSNDSFINRGPLATIDKESAFGTRVVHDRKRPNFPHIKEKLDLLGKFRNRSTFKHETMTKMSKSEQLFVILEIVNIFRALSLPEIEELITSIFSKPSGRELRYLLSILVAARYVTRKGTDEEYFVATDPPHSFFDYEGSESEIADIKIDILNNYQETDTPRFNFLES